MKLNLLLSAFMMCFIGYMNAQQSNYWIETSENAIPTEKSPKLLQQPLDASYYKLDIKALKQKLKAAPMEYTNSSKELVISFPLANGTVEEFIVSESPVMAPKLAAKYPNIKSFCGQGKNNPLHSIRFDYSPTGFHGSIHTEEGKIYIDPFTNGNGEYCVVYNTNEMSPLTENFYPELGCGVQADFFEAPDSKEKLQQQAQTNLRSAQVPVNVKVYRLCVLRYCIK